MPLHNDQLLYIQIRLAKSCSINFFRCDYITTKANYAQKTVASPGDNRLYHIKLKQLKLAVLPEVQPEVQQVLQLQTAVLLALLQAAEELPEPDKQA